ncbi:MAG TPA: radical SAM protein, partial [Prevotella sp.]
NKDRIPTHKRPTRTEVANALEIQLKKMQLAGEQPDVLTFAGNGEPTSHPDFAGIIDDTLRLRNQYCPNAKISVLSNSTFIHKPDVHNALLKVDNNILKLDTVDNDYIRLVDQPVGTRFNVTELIEHLKAFNGQLIIQTMFMRGTIGTQSVDNTGEQYVAPWLEAVKYIAPKEVMIYTIDRETPAQHLQKATPTELDAIKNRVIALGIPCTASY